MNTIQDKLRHGYPSKERIEAADRIELLENALQAANATIEEYERKYYLTLDALELQKEISALYLFLRDDFAVNSSDDRFEFAELAQLRGDDFDCKVTQEMEKHYASEPSSKTTGKPST